MTEEFNKLLRDIRFSRTETYDCTEGNVLAFRRKNDKWNGFTISLGNMCNGFPFEIVGVRFHNSECAYIAGAYAGNDLDSVRIQQLVVGERNGLKCKRIYRRKEEFIRYIRKDWYEFNVQWMLWIVWQKSLQNTLFADLLRQIPADVNVVENSSFQRGETAIFWGARNEELIALRKTKGKNAGHGVFDLGQYTGYNVMGKILKICSICLISGEEPPIDYELLNRKELFIYGRLLHFTSLSDMNQIR